MRRAFAVLAGVLMLPGCSHPPTSGEVDHKQHADAYTYTTTSCTSSITVGTGAYRHSMCVAYATHTWHRPAVWELCLINRDDKTRDPKGCREVTEAEWGSYHEGDYYPRRSQ